MSRLLFCTCLPLLFGSCAGHIELSPENCITKAKWGVTSTKKPDFSFDHSSWSPLGGFLTKKIMLKDILEDQDLSCQALQEINVVTTNGLIDKILGLTPLLTTKTYTISGTYYKHGTIRNDKHSRKEAN